ncbi:hypothetical protein AAL_05627 [Moelleriella libera RCEF 2490]|uniref:C6 transcription factor n=1 Tax=Moelleriella libera RCEF 2490 TaxID=1081109 RepID=A0A167ZYD6_9HYPO|nr:hypothetical protein AAL_05627 [Moelleriella libera RCEF 2490]
MVRSSQRWELDEPDLNDRGLPVIHDIAQKLGCIRPNSDVDLPVHSVFPEDEAGMSELARQLEEQQSKDGDTKDGERSQHHHDDRSSASEPDHSDFEDYRKTAFGGGNTITLSPQSFTGSNDYEFSPTMPDMDSSALFSSQPQSIPDFSSWSLPKTQQHSGLSMQYLPAEVLQQSMSMLGDQGLVGSDYSTVKPEILSCANPDVMISMDDPMIYAGFDSADGMRL